MNGLLKLYEAKLLPEEAERNEKTAKFRIGQVNLRM
jgi:hypothetical protein